MFTELAEGGGTKKILSSGHVTEAMLRSPLTKDYSQEVARPSGDCNQASQEQRRTNRILLDYREETWNQNHAVSSEGEAWLEPESAELSHSLQSHDRHWEGPLRGGTNFLIPPCKEPLTDVPARPASVIRTPTGAMSIRKSKQAFRLSNTFISLPVSYLKPNVKLSGHWSFSFFLFYSFLYNYSYSYSFLFLFVFPRNIAWPGLGSSTCQAPEMLGLFLGYQTVIFLHLLLLYH